MRQTVDEKLHTTLEKRLTDSFGLVTEQLGRVQLGLGEMKDLANGVGDLKRVLTNVKTRGGFGEVQSGLLLDQILAPQSNTYERPYSEGLAGVRRVRNSNARHGGWRAGTASGGRKVSAGGLGAAGRCAEPR